MDWTLPFVFIGIMVAAFVKGGIGFGFPTIATPLIALVTDVRSAIVLLILPNLVMDFVQLGRRPRMIMPIIRRHWVINLFAVLGTFVGTKFLATLGTRPLVLFLGVIIFLFAAMSFFEVTPRIPFGWEASLGPALGLVSGVVGGLTNLAGHMMIVYFYSIGLEKDEFVQTLSVSFVFFKLAQLGAVWQFNLLDPRLFQLSVFACAAALLAFRGGLLVRERINQRIFNRVVLIVLAVMSVGMIIRGLR